MELNEAHNREPSIDSSPCFARFGFETNLRNSHWPVDSQLQTTGGERFPSTRSTDAAPGLAVCLLIAGASDPLLGWENNEIRSPTTNSKG